MNGSYSKLVRSIFCLKSVNAFPKKKIVNDHSNSKKCYYL